MSRQARILPVLLAALLALALPSIAVAGPSAHQHHHEEAAGAGDSGGEPSLRGAEADCPGHHGGADHSDSGSCCGVGCSTAVVDELDGMPARLPATRPLPDAARRAAARDGDRLFHPPRPAA